MSVSPDNSNKKGISTQDQAQLELDAIYDTAPIGLCLLGTDTRYLRVNQHFADTDGFSIEEHIGKRVRDLLPALADAAEELTRNVVETGEPVLDIEISGETPKQPGVTRYWKESWRPIKDDQGRVIAINIVAEEITERKRAEESISYLATFPERNPNPTIEIDADGYVHYRNPSALHIFPDLQEGVQIHPYLEGLAEAFGAFLHRTADSIVREVQVGDRWYQQTIYHLPEVKRARIYGLDITERKRAEEALATAKMQLQSMMDNTPGLVYAFDLHERCIQANKALADLLGVPSDQLIGRQRHEFMLKHIADRDEANDRQVIESGSPLLFDEPGEFEGKSITYLTTKFPLRDANGMIYGVAGVSLDITERKRTEEHILRSNETFHNLIENNPMGTYVIDADFKMRNASLGARRAFANVPEPLIGRDLSECLRTMWPEPFASEAIARFRHTLDTGEPYIAKDTVEQRRDIEEVEAYDWRIERIVLPDGRYGVVCYYYDLTEQKKAEETLKEYAERLKRSNEDLERFAYISSHDLQEPLRTMVSFTQLLERRYKGKLDPDADEYLQYLINAGKRMQSLIQDLLEFSRVNTKGSEFRLTDATAVVEDALAFLHTKTQENGATVTSDPLPRVMADPVQLRQVFSNLISNAIKFRKPDVPPLIHISAQRQDGMVQFSVADNGIGIEPQYFEKIFVIFQRLHGMDTYEGTGIGLAIVKRIIDRHGGWIWVESEPGKGSTFHFTVPAIKELKLDGRVR